MPVTRTHPRDRIARMVRTALDSSPESGHRIAESLDVPGTSQAQLSKLANGQLRRIGWPALRAFGQRLGLDLEQLHQLHGEWEVAEATRADTLATRSSSRRHVPG